MSFCDDTDSDLMLVSTYVPVLQECLKGLLLLGLHEVCQKFMHCQPAIFVIVVCIIYIDACFTRTSKFAMSCGHLCAVAVMLWQQCVISQTEQSCIGISMIVFWLVDLGWTLASSLYCTFIVFSYISIVQETKMALAVSTIYAVHIWTACSTYYISDLMIRFVLYCGVCALLMFGGQVVLPSSEKYAQIRNVKWISCFVLFTAWVVLIPGLLVILSVYMHAFYRKKLLHNTELEGMGFSKDSAHNISQTSISSASACNFAYPSMPNENLNISQQMAVSSLSTLATQHTTSTAQISKNTNVAHDMAIMRQLQAAKAAAEFRKE